jgi:hypothetical protein
VIEISDLRKRIKQTIDQARHAASDRRQRQEVAIREGERALELVVTPIFRMTATILKAEGFAFQVFTPAGAVRLASERNRDDFIELALETDRDPVACVGRVSRTWGRRLLATEQIVREAPGLDGLTDEDVVRFLTTTLPPFVER